MYANRSPAAGTPTTADAVSCEPTATTGTADPRMAPIVSPARKLQGERFVEFMELFDGIPSMQVAVVHFLALLELTREGLVDLTQAEAYAPIYVRLAYTPA